MYSNLEMADMHLMYSLANCNNVLSRKLYKEKFPLRKCPDRRLFETIHQRLRETGSFLSNLENHGRNQSKNTLKLQDELQSKLDKDASVSSRVLSKELNVSQSTILKMLHEKDLYPFHFQQVQSLSEDDFIRRLIFCKWFLKKCDDTNFISSILFTD